jgi:antitoxin component of RelBE/YafQ-DinJ toxin-antitoxin module
MIKNRISIRLDEWLHKEVISISTASGIPISALIRELLEKGLDKYELAIDQHSLESEKTERQLKLITEVVLGTLYTVVALRNQSIEPSPNVEMVRNAVAIGSKASEEFLGDERG